MTSAIDRFKILLANALERVCVLEAELEEARERIAELEQLSANGSQDKLSEQVDVK
jgi:hypothetical protein